MIEEIHCHVVKKWRSTMLIIAGNVKRPSEKYVKAVMFR